MKQRIRYINILLAGMTALCLVGCGGSDEGKGSGTDSGNHAGETKEASLEDNFEWDGNLIVGLSDEGVRQESLIIPERCEGFNASVFLDRESDVKEVSFESDKDIDLNCVFLGAENLEYISLPAELTEIGDVEFSGCSSLKEITVPEEVTVIGNRAFQNNTSLERVVFQGDITTIMQNAFEACTSLREIELPDTVTSIEKYAFTECVSLTDITLPADLKEIGQFAFGNSGLETVNVPAEMELTAYESTSFIQLERRLNINVVEGSWADQNFDKVFEREIKNIVTDIS